MKQNLRLLKRICFLILLHVYIHATNGDFVLFLCPDQFLLLNAVIR